MDIPKLIFFIDLFLLSIGVFAQDYGVNVKIIGYDQGLPDELTQSLDQDKDKYIWISSTKYLSKYDGNGFKNYSKESLGVKVGSRLVFIPDNNNHIWYYNSTPTSLGKYLNLQILNPFNNKKETFNVFFKEAPFRDREIILPLYRNSKYDIFITVRNKGLYKYDGQSFTLIHKETKNKKYPIHYYSNDRFDWFAYNKTILRVNKESLHIDKYVSPYLVLYIREFNKYPVFITGDNKKHLYYIFHLKDNILINTFPKYEYPRYEKEYINLFQKDCNGNYWIKLNKECLYINGKGGEITKYIYDDSIHDQLNKKFSFVDTFNNLWYTSNRGIYRIKIVKNYFKKHLLKESLRAIFKREGKIYVNTQAGIKSIDLKSNVVNDVKTKLRHPVGSLYYNDTLWQTTTFKVVNYSFKTKETIAFYPIDSSRVNYNAIVRHPKTHTIFVGGNHELHKINTEDRSVVPLNIIKEYTLIEDVKINNFTIDRDRIWIATNKGFFLMDKDEKIIDWYNKEKGLPNENIIHIFIEKSIFWIATYGGGLIKWDRSKNTFMSFTKKEGLSNNNVYGIYKDSFDFLWLPTDKGLNRYAPKTGKNSIYMPSEGLAHREFNALSSFQDTESGIIYLGGINGLTSFSPSQFLETKLKEGTLSKPKIIIKNILVANKNKLVDKTNIILDNNIISFPEDYKYVEMSFTLLDFLDEEPLQYQYKIQGVDDDYRICEGNKIVLSSLPKQKNTLYIKAQSANGMWTDLNNPLTVVIKKVYPKLQFFLFSVSILILYLLFKFNSIRKPKKNVKKLTSNITSKTTNEVNRISDKLTKEWIKKLDFSITKHMSSITFSIEFLSQEMGLSERQLQRRIKRVTGKTPNKYITEIRLKEAFRLIENQEINTVKELSQIVGFTTTEYFSRLFKERFGENPSNLINFKKNKVYNKRL